MERLTERNPLWIDDELWERACEPDCEEIDAVYRKLKDYEDAEEQELLLRLPCKVGDKVYQISENFIEPCTVETIFLGNYRDRNGNWCNMAEIHYDRDDCPYVSTEIYFTDIGETVFLTESEAEAKLKEMEEKDSVNYIHELMAQLELYESYKKDFAKTYMLRIMKNKIIWIILVISIGIFIAA